MQMLHWAKGNDHQRETRAQAEVAHVAFVKCDSVADIAWLASQTVFQRLKHGSRVVHSVNFHALASEGQKNASGAAGHFEDWANGLLRELKVEG